MGAETVQTPNGKTLTQAVECLRSGRLVAFPTETVYGLGGDATSDRAVTAIYAAKNRPVFNPLIVHTHSVDTIEKLVVMDERARLLAGRFWPGPLTLVLPRSPNCPVSLLASAGLASLAVRIPSHPAALALLRAFGKPVAAPSANPSGRLSPTTAAHVRRAFGQAVEVVLDAGAAPLGLESTVVSLLDQPARLLRPGAIPAERLAEVLGHQPLAAGPAKEKLSPGQMESHYAPVTPLRLNAKEPRHDEAFIAFGPVQPGIGGLTINLSPDGDLAEAASRLFAALHEMDAAGVDCIAVAPIPEEGLGVAINDRLRRAAAPRSD